MTTVPVPSAELTVGRQGHYAGAVSRLAPSPPTSGQSWGAYTLGVALLNAAVKLRDRALLHAHQPPGPGLVTWLVWEFFYFTYQWAVSGKTLGMAVLGLQVVTREGGPSAAARPSCGRSGSGSAC